MRELSESIPRWEDIGTKVYGGTKDGEEARWITHIAGHANCLGYDSKAAILSLHEAAHVIVGLTVEVGVTGDTTIKPTADLAGSTQCEPFPEDLRQHLNASLTGADLRLNHAQECRIQSRIVYSVASIAIIGLIMREDYRLGEQILNLKANKEIKPPPGCRPDYLEANGSACRIAGVRNGALMAWAIERAKDVVENNARHVRTLAAALLELETINIEDIDQIVRAIGPLKSGRTNVPIFYIGG